MYYYKYYIIYPILYGFLKKFKNLQSQIEEYKRTLIGKRDNIPIPLVNWADMEILA